MGIRIIDTAKVTRIRTRNLTRPLSIIRISDPDSLNSIFLDAHSATMIWDVNDGILKEVLRLAELGFIDVVVENGDSNPIGVEHRESTSKRCLAGRRTIYFSGREDGLR